MCLRFSMAPDVGDSSLRTVRTGAQRAAALVPILSVTILILAVVMMLLERLKKVMNHIIGHVFALLQSVLAGGAEVRAQPDAGICIFPGCLGETVIGTKHATRRCAGRDAETEVVCSEEAGQYLSYRPTNR